MSSFGAGGGSATGGAKPQAQSLMSGLGLDKLTQMLGQQLQLGTQGAPVQPGNEGRMSPQQRLAQVMQQYSQV